MFPLKYLIPAALLVVAVPAQAATPHSCQMLNEADALGLFEQWNASLKTGDPLKVAKLYQHDAVLLPTVSNAPRLTQAERVDYFSHFLADRPSGRLNSHHLKRGCDTATLAGLYTFDFASTGRQVAARYTFIYRWDGQAWLIDHHHSSLLPQS